VTQRTLILTVMIVGLVSIACMPASARPQAKKGPPADDELLKELDVKLLDELDRELFQPEDKPAGQGVVGPRGKASGQRSEGSDLRPADRPAPDSGGNHSPLLRIARKMRQVETQIGRADCGSHTQDAQQQIASDLQALIDQLRRSCQQGKPSQGSSQAVAPGKPAGRPTTKKPSGGRKKPASKPGKSGTPKPTKAAVRRGEEDRIRSVLKELWGELPEHAREQMMQLPAEKSLPEYQSMIEEYFKRLVEEQPAAANP